MCRERKKWCKLLRENMVYTIMVKVIWIFLWR